VARGASGYVRFSARLELHLHYSTVIVIRVSTDLVPAGIQKHAAGCHGEARNHAFHLSVLSLEDGSTISYMEGGPAANRPLFDGFQGSQCTASVPGEVVQATAIGLDRSASRDIDVSGSGKRAVWLQDKGKRSGAILKLDDHLARFWQHGISFGIERVAAFERCGIIAKFDLQSALCCVRSVQAQSGCGIR